MTHQYSKFLHPLYLIGDLLLLNLSFIGAFAYQFANLKLTQTPYFFLMIFFNIIWIFVSVLLDNHEKNRMATDAAIVKKIAKGLGLHIATIATILLFLKAVYFSRLHLVYTYALFGALIIAWRISFIYFLRSYRTKGYNFRSYVIAGISSSGQSLLQLYNKHPEFGYRFMGYFDNKVARDGVVGKICDIKNYVKENNIDEIYCSVSDIDKSYVKDLVKFGDQNMVRVKLLSSSQDSTTAQKLFAVQYGSLNVFSFRHEPLNDSFSKVSKRIFDIVFSSLVMICIHSWLIPIIAILIKMDSKGPVFFKQKRTGRDGKEFWCLKFRTMKVNNDSDSKQATKNDSRITPLGAFLRKSSIDELPQFINTFLGDMSVVGPRPHMLKHTEYYSQEVDKFMVRHLVKPGITGLAQTKGFRGETKEVSAMKNRVRMDVFYVENWSLFLDIKIIFMTVFNMVRGEKNAY
ncbi:undecaprenyl-phosphate glucose phosphotransferase [Microscilla marina]|nr:undecaprenyl-phosphate glucose phosphotransferase [Microscilla marina]